MSARYYFFPISIWVRSTGGGAGEADEIRDGGLFYMPRAPHRNQHDGLIPPYVDCWRSGGAAKKLAGVLGQGLVLLFPFFIWIRSFGGA